MCANNLSHSLDVTQTVGKSLIYMLKRTGPNIEPCGTPADRHYELDLWLSILTDLEQER